MELCPSRRGVLAGAAMAALAGALPVPGTASAAEPGIAGRLRALEDEHSARLGVFARDLHTGRAVRHRADELFPMCSTWKAVEVAAVLRDLDRDGTYLARRVHYTRQDVARSGYAPITGLPANLAHGMTAGQLCAAALDCSDNTAANLLLRLLGGPPAITRFCRSLGDEVSRLDRWEPELNSAEPGRVTDTSSPRALGRTVARLTLGDALDRADRERLTDWMLANTTGGKRLRAGLPSGWTVADKTGSGDYGATNDVAVVWPPARRPIIMAVLSTKHEPTAPADEPLLAATAALLATAFVPR